jgi:hypothetical protein
VAGLDTGGPVFATWSWPPPKPFKRCKAPVQAIRGKASDGRNIVGQYRPSSVDACRSRTRSGRANRPTLASPDFSQGGRLLC